MLNLDMYDPLLVGIVLDLGDIYSGKELTDLVYVQQAFQNVIERCMEPEDRCYIWSSDDFEVPNRKGASVPKLNKHRPIIFDVDEAVRQSLYLLNLETDYSYRKFIFCVSNRYSSKYDYGIQKVQGFDMRNYWETTFVFCGIGDLYDKDSFESLKNNHPRTHYWHFNTPDGLKEQVSKFIREQVEINYGEEDVSHEGEL